MNRPFGSRALSILATGIGAAALLGPAPARAIETINLRLPLLETDFSIRVAELRSPDALIAGDSDLAELDRATRGEIGRRLKAVVNSNLPLKIEAVFARARDHRCWIRCCFWLGL